MNAEKAAHLFRGKQPFSQIITSIKAGPGRNVFVVPGTDGHHEEYS
jgi:hypothetical protein